jgi:hypothetical protein
MSHARESENDIIQEYTLRGYIPYDNRIHNRNDLKNELKSIIKDYIETHIQNYENNLDISIYELEKHIKVFGEKFLNLKTKNLSKCIAYLNKEIKININNYNNNRQNYIINDTIMNEIIEKATEKAIGRSSRQSTRRNTSRTPSPPRLTRQNATSGGNKKKSRKIYKKKSKKIYKKN